MVLSAGLLACRGRVQREGEVIHLIAEHLIDLSDLLRSVGERNEPFPVPHGRGDEAKHGGGPDQRKLTGSGASRGTSTFPICGSGVGSRSRPGTSGRQTPELTHANTSLARNANAPATPCR